ncbi:MAG: hypothetical protein ABUS54_00080 [Actinomycetota bacterium]
MSFFLLTFSRRNGSQPEIESFDDAGIAMDRFVAAERLHRDTDDGKGVVLLLADDVDTLRRTHSHYFLTTEELLENARSAS